MPTTTPVRSWLLGTPSRADALQLYCFPHAGGNPVEYLRWAAQLPDAELHIVQLPGRGSRHQEPHATSIDRLVTDFLADVPLARPYAFFGHSLGALIAYEVTRALRDAGRRLPQDLIVSAFPAPHLPRSTRHLHTLPDDQLLQAVARRHGGIPREILGSPQIRALIVNPLRSDLRLAETHHHRPCTPLPVPLTVFAGNGDRVSQGQLAAWQQHTIEPITVRSFPGDHFYFRDHETQVLNTLNDALRSPQ
ncbi:thioesterase II family protein [Streptomyces sp. CA-135486]|uniref:thioesterase II family protein n=1 Tax=Streptomyces sp. CA-135486 TaxID=3240049 RepID=UPI003D8E0884